MRTASKHPYDTVTSLQDFGDGSGDTIYHWQDLLNSAVRYTSMNYTNQALAFLEEVHEIQTKSRMFSVRLKRSLQI